ncbi:hypothetical protein GPECTOR_62g889 [Gonium pectorale]|uniref:Methyltransferase FkbM domain-containing protein n=1 Tax=Gonium pectorale TaxID=33097 RepID=A0A150G4M5_GONPE|nr:hypothetical protein GPECTOR_62g889 [Gonium pectorale]|eukprot:KXZ44774.1 hypothetical protein GPECTOR_62g889 [Gonium pectorale]
MAVASGLCGAVRARRPARGLVIIAARNGICEDGSNVMTDNRPDRPGLQVACDFGTDCSDCGPLSSNMSGPIDFLLRQGVRVWARRLAMEPYPVMAYTDPKADLDVSDQVERVGCMEIGIVQIFKEVLGARCAPYKRGASGAAAAGGGYSSVSRSAPLVVDVGANFGYFTLLAASMGCRVIAVEPVPRFLAFLHWSLAANGLRPTVSTDPTASPPAGAADPPAVTVVERIVSDLAGLNLTISVPRKGVWGTANVASLHPPDVEPESIVVPTVRLDDIVRDESVALLKVDVEGYEPSVFRSATSLVRSGRAEHIVFEYTPGFLQQLSEPIPPMMEVTQRAVLYDLADVAWFRNHSYGMLPGSVCPWPKELVAANAAWSHS